ncbi:unnamed protein product [Phaedon cochleariae]|uniref:Sialin n=1 Tax=Phaedon cochleariae TaxID=80249 RepID=A0A9P0GR73_PHACE|nr:unnamed protein product [Phaedon cochleariae]
MQTGLMISTVLEVPGTKGAELHEDIKKSSWKLWKTRRYIIALLGFGGFFMMYALRTNLSIAIVPMTEMKNITSQNGTIIQKREFDWDTQTQGYVLSSFFYGYILTPILGGYLAERFGGKKTLAVGIGVTSLLTVITPWVARINVYLFILIRTLEGIFEGVSYPCIYSLWSKWAPPLERSRLLATSLSGSYVGIIVSMPVCSLLATSIGWESIFYVFGTIGLLWTFLWVQFVGDSPEEDSRINNLELEYITNSKAKVKNETKLRTPWIAMMKSLPVWAIIVANVSDNWGFYTLLTELPKFMKHALHFDLNQAGFISSVPYLVLSVSTVIGGHVADWFLRVSPFSTSAVRKIFNTISFMGQMLFLILAAYLMSPLPTTICFTLATGMAGFAAGGFGVNHLDIAPEFAGTICGVALTLAVIPGIVSPILTGYIVTDEESTDEWKIVFYISACIYLIGIIFYVSFASGELQPWAMKIDSSKETHEEESRGETCEGSVNRSFQDEQISSNV